MLFSKSGCCRWESGYILMERLSMAPILGRTRMIQSIIMCGKLSVCLMNVELPQAISCQKQSPLYASKFTWIKWQCNSWLIVPVHCSYPPTAGNICLPKDGCCRDITLYWLNTSDWMTYRYIRQMDSHSKF